MMNRKLLSLILLSWPLVASAGGEDVWEYEAETVPLSESKNYPILGGVVGVGFRHSLDSPTDAELKDYWNEQKYPELFKCSGEALEAQKRLMATDADYGNLRKESAVDEDFLRNLRKQRVSEQTIADIRLAWPCEPWSRAKRTAITQYKNSIGGVQRKLRFARASRTGGGWTMETLAVSSIFSQYFFHGRPEIIARATLRLDNCDNDPVAPEIDLAEVPLPNLIARFEEIDFKNFWQCTLKVDPNSIVIKQAMLKPEIAYGANLFMLKNLSVTVIPEGDVYLESSKSGADQSDMRVLYKPRNVKPLDETRRRMALNGAANFVNLLREHGRLIARYGTSGASRGEIQRIATESLAVRKAQMMRELGALNGNYAYLTLIDRLSVSASVEKAYRYFQAIELRVAKLINDNERLNLDSLVNPAAAKSSPTNPISAQ